MILQALYNFYDNRIIGTKWDVPYGFSWERVGFVLVIDKNGNMVTEPQDLRDHSGKIPRGRLCLVPWTNEVDVRSSNIWSNFLVDRVGYVLGFESGKKSDRLIKAKKDFITRFETICGNTNDLGLLAVHAFLSKWKPDRTRDLKQWEEICGPQGGLIAFQLQGDERNRFIHDRPAARVAWTSYLNQQTSPEGQCLVTGRVGPIQLQTAQFRGIIGGQSTGTSLISFNAPAFESYGKNKDISSLNAPISIEAEFKSSTALKYLLRSHSNKVRVADATVLYWTAQPSRVEEFMGLVFETSDDAAEVARLREWLEAVRSGHYSKDLDPSVPFYILGLAAPAKARISVRFWYAGNVGEMGERVKRHFDNLAIECLYDNEPEYPSLHRLLRETAVFHKNNRNTPKSVDDDKNIPETLADAMMRSILIGGRYPASLLPILLSRARAEQSEKDKKTGKPKLNVNYFRAALIKAALVRNYNKEVSMSLNPECREPGYLLGRLFAVLERAQAEAINNPNATIRDRYFGSASATPCAVFPVLLRLVQHHIAKAEYGGIRDREIGEIVERIAEFPKRLSLEQQGMFALGYYHQRNKR